MAKRIIHLAVKVGDLINKDPDTRDLLRLYFLPDYNVSLAEVIIPGESGCMYYGSANTFVICCVWLFT
jgi:starch phosphorylase